MAKNENFVQDIANIDEDFAKWYTDIVIKTELADYTDTKGCIAIKPYGYEIWENIRNYADKLFKESEQEIDKMKSLKNKNILKGFIVYLKNRIK